MTRLAALAAVAMLAACTSNVQSQDRAIALAMAGQSQVSGEALDRRLTAADKHPLGSEKNPVRAEMPPGERAYLARLRCSDGKAPAFERIGSFGSGPYGNILDGYTVNCGNAAPGQVQVFMDMYHRGHVETRAVPGFTIVPVG